MEKMVLSLQARFQTQEQNVREGKASSNIFYDIDGQDEDSNSSLPTVSRLTVMSDAAETVGEQFLRLIAIHTTGSSSSSSSSSGGGGVLFFFWMFSVIDQWQRNSTLPQPGVEIKGSNPGLLNHNNSLFWFILGAMQLEQLEVDAKSMMSRIKNKERRKRVMKKDSALSGEEVESSPNVE
jgi:hypothetical protein